MLDVENYRHRREETLKQLAHRLANRVKQNGESVTLEPMNGYERKIIHVALQNTRKYGRKAKAKIRTVTSSFIIKDKV